MIGGGGDFVGGGHSNEEMDLWESNNYYSTVNKYDWGIKKMITLKRNIGKELQFT